jgi:hypothetical protein
MPRVGPSARKETRDPDIANVKQFGAVGNGVADDTGAIQSAINATPPGGGIILFPVGTYRVIRSLIGKGGTLLQGMSRAFTTILYTGTAPISMLLYDTAGHFAVRDISFKTSQGGHASVQLHIRNSVYFDLQNITSWVGGTKGVANNQIIGILIESTATGFVPPRGFGRISNFLYTPPGGAAASGSRGIELRGIPGQATENMVIDGWGNIEDAEVGILFNVAYHCVIDGSYFLQGNTTGIRFTSSQYNIVKRPRLAASVSHIDIDAKSFDNVIIQPSFFSPPSFGNNHGVRTVIISSGDLDVPTDLTSQVRAGSLGVGNAAPGSTLGSVKRKIEVFDANGVSLGFVPVYDAIA